MKAKTQLDQVISTLKSLSPSEAELYGLCAGKFVHPGSKSQPAQGEIGIALLGDDACAYRIALADACEILAVVSKDISVAARG